MLVVSDPLTSLAAASCDVGVGSFQDPPNIPGTLPSYLVTWLPGYLVTWLPGYLVTWLPGYLVTWLPGYLVTWLPGYPL